MTQRFCFLFLCRTARHANPPHWSETHRRLAHIGGQSFLRNSGYSAGVSVYLYLLKNFVSPLMLSFIHMVWENMVNHTNGTRLFLSAIASQHPHSARRLDTSQHAPRFWRRCKLSWCYCVASCAGSLCVTHEQGTANCPAGFCG